MNRVPIRRKNKFGAVRSTSALTDRSFDSKAERRRGDQLRLMELAGAISDLEFQPKTRLSAANIGYKPDFRYVQDGVTIYEDVKGVATEGFRIKARLWGSYGPAQLRILKVRGTGFIISKTISPPEK